MGNLTKGGKGIDQRILEVYHQIYEIDKNNTVLQMIHVQGKGVILSDNVHRFYEGSIRDKYKRVLEDLEMELKKYNISGQN